MNTKIHITKLFNIPTSKHGKKFIIVVSLALLIILLGIVFIHFSKKEHLTLEENTTPSEIVTQDLSGNNLVNKDLSGNNLVTPDRNPRLEKYSIFDDTEFKYNSHALDGTYSTMKDCHDSAKEYIIGKKPILKETDFIGAEFHDETKICKAYYKANSTTLADQDEGNKLYLSNEYNKSL